MMSRLCVLILCLLWFLGCSKDNYSLSQVESTLRAIGADAYRAGSLSTMYGGPGCVEAQWIGIDQERMMLFRYETQVRAKNAQSEIRHSVRSRNLIFAPARNIDTPISEEVIKKIDKALGMD